MAATLKSLWLIGVAALALSACQPTSRSAASFKAIDITGADYARELNLPDAHGAGRTLLDFKGKVTVVFFGFTQCPDVCPTTLLELAKVKKALPRHAAPSPESEPQFGRHATRHVQRR